MCADDSTPSQLARKQRTRRACVTARRRSSSRSTDRVMRDTSVRCCCSYGSARRATVGANTRPLRILCLQCAARRVADDGIARASAGTPLSTPGGWRRGRGAGTYSPSVSARSARNRVSTTATTFVAMARAPRSTRDREVDQTTLPDEHEEELGDGGLPKEVRERLAGRPECRPHVVLSTRCRTVNGTTACRQTSEFYVACPGERSVRAVIPRE